MRQVESILTIIAVFTVLLSAAALSFAESPEAFHVIHVKGTILLKDTGRQVEVGDRVTAETELVFATEDAVAAVISREKGRFTLRADKLASEEQTSELAGFVKECFFPSRKLTSSRGGNRFRKTNRSGLIRSDFSEELLLLTESMKIKVNPLLFPMHTQAFFYVRYLYQGEEINKKLRYEKDIVFFERDSIYRVDQHPIPAEETSEMRLYYYSISQKGEPMSFKMANFPDEQRLRKEVATLVSVLHASDAEQRKITETVIAFLDEFYGSSHHNNVAAWLEEHF